MKENKFLLMVNSPLSNELQELAAGYVSDDLEPADVAQVERLMGENPALRKEIRQLQAIMGAMASSVPQMKPPSHLLDKIMAEIDPPKADLQVDMNHMLVNLGRWFDDIFEPLWQPPAALNLAFSSRRKTEVTQQSIRRGKIIEFESENSENDVQAFILLIEIIAQPEGKISVSIQVYPQPGQWHLPANLELKFISKAGEVLQSIQARSEDNYIKLPRFTASSKFQFSLQINLNEFSRTEKFIL